MVTMTKKNKEGYMYGGLDEGSFFCTRCKKGHHKLSAIGKAHREFTR